MQKTAKCFNIPLLLPIFNLTSVQNLIIALLILNCRLFKGEFYEHKIH